MKQPLHQAPRRRISSFFLRPQSRTAAAARRGRADYRATPRAAQQRALPAAVAGPEAPLQQPEAAACP